jgi:hypothetical protein
MECVEDIDNLYEYDSYWLYVDCNEFDWLE